MLRLLFAVSVTIELVVKARATFLVNWVSESEGDALREPAVIDESGGLKLHVRAINFEIRTELILPSLCPLESLPQERTVYK